MSYEVLVKEAQTLTYEERVNLMAVLEKVDDSISDGITLKDVCYRTGNYGAYTRAMAFIDMQ